MLNGAQRAETVREVAERAALWNEVRTDDFQDRIIKLIHTARKQFRTGPEGELPRPRTDPLYDALMGIADVADASPLAVRDACACALDAAEEVTTPTG